MMWKIGSYQGNTNVRCGWPAEGQHGLNRGALQLALPVCILWKGCVQMYTQLHIIAFALVIYWLSRNTCPEDDLCPVRVMRCMNSNHPLGIVSVDQGLKSATVSYCIGALISYAEKVSLARFPNHLLPINDRWKPSAASLLGPLRPPDGPSV